MEQLLSLSFPFFFPFFSSSFFFFVIQSMVFVSSNRWRCDDPQWNRAEVSADRDSKQGRRVRPGASCNTLEGGGRCVGRLFARIRGLGPVWFNGR